EWVHVQLHQQKGMISLSPPTICNSAIGSRLYLSAGKGSVLIRRLAPLKLTGGRLKQRLKRCKS
ncbi:MULTISPECIES: hypothetical protein, partial [Serratia]|uniref:hypothetical protein n=1 Tax=Enterobacterales TaxID=91347 RepID=UPI00313B5AA8